MKKTNTILLLLAFVLAANTIFAQAVENRWLEEVFTEVEVEADVTYGVNATVLRLPELGEAIPEELKMDIYTPVGDDIDSRPAVLVFHTGNFLPNVTNGQISGTRKDSSVVEFCTRLARYGYTAAAVTYRKGWNPLAATQPERALGLIQAAYRGVQDGRTAVRYLRKTHAEDGNPYGIDPDRIAIIGLGTGGYLTLGMVGLTDYNKIVTTTNGPAKFILDVNGDGIPETPMVVPVYHGDIEGKELAVSPDDAFGYPAGDTSSYVNLPEYSSDFNLCMNVGGALGDISWLDETTVPIITVQSAFDQFAPYEDDVLIVPTTGDPIVRVQGGLEIAKKQEDLGTNQAWYDANIDDVFTTTAMTNSMNAGHQYYEGLYPVTNPANTNGVDEGVVINWWDPGALSPPILPDFPNGVPWNMLPHPSGGTFHTQGLLTNVGMSAEKARTNIDTVFGYFIPRAYITLNLATNTTELLDENEVNLSVAPNPVDNQVVISTNSATPMEAIQIFDMNGRLVRSYTNVNNNVYFIPRGNLPGGMYAVKIKFEKGIIAKKLMFR